MPITEKPMLFSGPMVRAIIDGRKVQTRRVVKPQPVDCPTDALAFQPHKDSHPNIWTIQSTGMGPAEYAKTPYAPHVHGVECWRELCPHPVGSRIWVRETIAIGPKNHGWTNGNGVIYKATHGAALDPKCEGFTAWKPSIHMPRWASRITLEVTDVRVQRLQEISQHDAASEGVHYGSINGQTVTPLDAFINIWKSINGPDSWQANPWVWAYTFRRVPEGGEG